MTVQKKTGKILKETYRVETRKLFGWKVLPESQTKSYEETRDWAEKNLGFIPHYLFYGQEEEID